MQPQEATLALARDLISRRSVSPQDGGCQPLLAERLRRLGFEVEEMRNGKG
jgi:succinyl-diaminopimelate desuccinylase